MAAAVEQFESRQLLTSGPPILFVVNTLTDTTDANIGDGLAQDASGNTSLRAAIQEANAQTQRSVTIQLMSGTHTLTINGPGEDNAATGDLDINSAVSVTIRGVASGTSIIDADFNVATTDRVFDIALANFVAIEDVRIQDGQRDSGGAIDNAGSLRIVRSTFFNNRGDTGTDPVRGGAIHNASSGSLFVVASGFDTNSTSGEGGAIFNAGQAFFDGVTFFNNESDGSGNNHGGAIFNASGGMLNVRRSLFEDNTAGGSTTGDGGAIFTAGAANVEQSTFSNNQGDNGGAIEVASGGSLFLSASTLTLNTALLGGGVDFNGASNSAAVVNTIIAQNTANDVEFSDVRTGGNGFSTLGFNLIGIGPSVGVGFTDGVNGDRVGTSSTPIDPMLGSLADNGGPTRTHGLLAGSPAIDTGNALPPPIGEVALATETDQRGVPRVLFGGNTTQQDIGAFESGFLGFIVNTTNDTPDADLMDNLALDASGNTSLRAAIMQSDANGARDIVIEPGIYTLTRVGTETEFSEFGDLDLVASELRLIGFGSVSTTVDANQIDRALDVSAAATVSGLRIRNGDAGADVGGGIRNFASLTLVDVAIENSQAADGGGIYNGGILTAEQIFLSGNVATGNGGGMLQASFLPPVISNSTFIGNQAGEDGGGIAAEFQSEIDIFELRNVTILGNTAGNDGGGIANAGTLSIFGGVVNGNTAGRDAGGLGNSGTVVLQDVSLVGNHADRDAGGIGTTGIATILRSVIEDNTAGRDAGGIGIAGLDGMAFGDTLGGEDSADVTIIASQIEDNSAANDGGGIALAGGKSVRVEFTTIHNNLALSGAGGGVFVSDGRMLLDQSSIASNVAGQTGTAFGDGGGVYVTGGATAIINSTISGNSAIQFNSQGGAGGGVMHAAGQLELASVTISNNTAALGGGLATFANSQPLDTFLSNRGTVHNTIIAENTAASGPDVFAFDGGETGQDPFIGSLGNNLIGISGAGSAGTIFVDGVRDDQVGTSSTPLDPELGALANNGGLTLTHALLASSPAIDAGSVEAEDDFDQRGVPRAINGSTSLVQDIGAFELGFDGIFVTTPADTVDAGDGQTSLREAIRQANSTPGEQAIVLPSGRYELTRFGRDENAGLVGDLDITDDVQILGYGALTTIIDGLGQDRVFDILSGNTVTLRGLRIEAGRALGAGAGAADGGGIAAFESNLTLIFVEMVNNTADGGAGGAIKFDQGASTTSLTIFESLFEGNTARFGASGGGALAQFGGSLSLTNSTIRGNTAVSTGQGGGGVQLLNVNATIMNTLFEGNSTLFTGSGGGLFSASNTSSFTTSISNSLFNGNTAVTSGGGLVINGATMTAFLTNSTLLQNNAQSGFGGGIEIEGGATATISGSTILGNNSTNGGGGLNVDDTSSLTLMNSDVSGNVSSAEGGGLLTAGTTTVSGSTLSQNSSSLGAGIALTEGSLTLTSSTISGNSGRGLDVASGASATLLNVTITDNFADNGGGIRNQGTTSLKNTLVAGNALFFATPTDSDLSGSFTSNGNNLIGDLDGATGFTNGVNADIVGGVTSTTIDTVSQTTSNPLRVTTTAAHGLTTGDRVRIRGVTGSVQPAGFFTITRIDPTTFDLNDTGFGSAATGTGGTVTEVVNPLLGPLENNKTPGSRFDLPPSLFDLPTGPVVTNTHALLPGSPAIDAGTNSGAPATDQNGFPIPSDGDDSGTATADIGAFEVFLTTVTGRFFQDDDGDAIFDGSEFGLPNRTVYLDANRNGQYDNGEPFATTGFDDPGTAGVDETGTYVLELVPPGEQVIDVLLDEHERRTTPLTPLLGDPSPDFVGVQPKAVALADLDFDGDLDVAAVDFASNTLQRFLYDQGTLTLAGDLTMNGPRDVKIADVDNDGIQDIIVVNTGNSGNDTVTIVRRTLFGFAMPIDVTVGRNPHSVAVGKLNDDAFVDLAVTNSLDGSLKILFGNGDGTFTNGPTLSINESGPEEVVIADFNLDFQLDIAVAFTGADMIGVVFNDNGNFGTINSFPTGAGSQPHSLVVEDFNHDGRPDLAFGATGTNQVGLLLNRPFGPFDAPLTVGSAASPTSLAAADIDLDGDIDLIAGGGSSDPGNITTFRNMGDATFATPVVHMTETVVNDIAVGEFTGDGRPDLVVGSNTLGASLEILPQLTGANLVTAETGVATTNANFGVQPLGSITGTIFNDLDNNGFQFSAEPGLVGVSLFLDMNGNGRQDPFEPVTGTQADDPATTFIDESGKYTFENLIPGDYRVYQYAPDGFRQNGPRELLFDLKTVAQTGVNAVDSASVDVDLDGNLDLVVIEQGAGTAMIRLFVGDGLGNLLPNVDLAIGGNPRTLRAGNFNDDPEPEFAVTSDAGVQILDFDSGSGFDIVATLGLSEDDAYDLELADVNGDGFQDVVASSITQDTNGSSSAIDIILGNGNLTFNAPSTLSNGGEIYAIELADFDGDLDLDLAALNSAASVNNFKIFTNSGAGSFTLAATEAAELDGETGRAVPGALVAADFNNDGFIDLAIAATDTGIFLKQNVSFGSTIDFIGGFSPIPIVTNNFAFRDLDTENRLVFDFQRLPELVATDLLGNIQVLEGFSSGVFANPQIFPVGVNPTGVGFGDFDRDGRTDIAFVRDSAAAAQFVLFNRLGNELISVDPAFTSFAQDIADIQPASVSGMVFDDLNGNGVMDGSDAGLPNITVFADFNFNGRIDLLEPTATTNAAGEYTIQGIEPRHASIIRPSLPAGRTSTAPVGLQFGPPQVLSVGGSRSAVVTDSVIGVDLDADFGTNNDLVVINPGVGNEVKVFLNKELTGEITTTTLTFDASREAVAVRVGDVTNDGLQDIVLVLDDGNLALFAGQFSGGFADDVVVTTGVSNVTAFELFDFSLTSGDPDGDLDVLLVTADGDLVPLRNDDGTLVVQATIDVPGATSGGDIAIDNFDFDLESLIDIAFVDFTGDKVHVGIQQASGGFSFASVSVGDGPISLAVGRDFDTFDPLLAVAHQTDKTLRTFSGPGTFTAGPMVTLTDTPGLVTIAAASGSLPQQIGVAHTDSDFVSLISNNGTLGTLQRVNVGSEQDAITATDLNGDAIDDLIVNRLDGTVALFESRTGPMNGTYHVFPRAGEELTTFDFGSSIAGASEVEIAIVGNDLTITDINVGNDQLTVSTDGSNILISSIGTLFTNIASATGDGTNFVTVPLSAFTGRILVNTLNGDDAFTIDVAAGNFTRDIQFSGGNGNDSATLGLPSTSGSVKAVSLSAENVNLFADVTLGGNLTASARDIVVTPDVDLVATGSFSINLVASRNIGLFDASLTAVNGDILLSANQQAVAETGPFMGIIAVGTTIETSGTGDIELQGRGGNSGNSNFGVSLEQGSIVRSTSTSASAGQITIQGTGGNGANANTGVQISGAGTQVASTSGDIQISGLGGDASGSTNFGVNLLDGAQVLSQGTDANAATITISGTGGDGVADNNGVVLAGTNTLVRSVAGAIEINGMAGSGSDPGVTGVQVIQDAHIESTGTGSLAATITINGSGGTSNTNSQLGIFVGAGNTVITSVDGDIALNGTGGPSTAEGLRGFGMNSGTISSTGTGASAATITLTGMGGPTGTGRTNDGVSIIQAATITSAKGDVQITGIGGGGGTTGDNWGLEVSGTISVGSTGSLVLTGTGGQGTGTHNFGIQVFDGASITTTDGLLALTGSQGGSPAGDALAIETSGTNTIATNGAGPLFLIGDSMSLGTSSTVRAGSSGTGSVVVHPLSDNGAIDLGSTSDSAVNTLELSDAELDRIATGTLFVQDSLAGAITVSNAITLANNLSLTNGTSITVNQSITLATDKSLSVVAGNTINLGAATSDIAVSGTGSMNLSAQSNISAASGASLSVVNGNLMMSANQGVGPATGGLTGILLDGATLTTSGTGDITLAGKGDDRNNVGLRHGIHLQNGAVVQATFAGSGSENVQLALNGQGGSGRNDDYGVLIEGTGSMVTAANGQISINGTGGNGTNEDNIGVLLFNGGQVTSTGTDANAATISIMGTGGAGTFGIDGVLLQNAGSQVTSVRGNVSITGTGGAGTSGFSRGVFLLDGGKVISQGTGSQAATLTINGTGGSVSDSNNGVQLTGTGSIIRSTDGAIVINGTGGTSSGAFNRGVSLFNDARIESIGTGANAATITVNGMGGAGTGNGQRGIQIGANAATITSIDGDIQLNGTGGTGAGFNQGIIFFAGTVQSTGTGADAANITLTGTGGVSASGFDDGITMNNSSQTISSQNGNIQLTGTGGGDAGSASNWGLNLIGTLSAGGAGSLSLMGTGGVGSAGDNVGVAIGDTASATAGDGGIAITGVAGAGSSLALQFSGTNTVATSSNGTLALTADSIAIGANSTLQAGDSGSGSASIRPFTNGTAINLGSGTDSSASTLELSDAELDRVFAGTLSFGNTNSGGITVSNAISRSAATNLMLTAAVDNGLTFSGSTASLDANGGDVTISLSGSGSAMVVSGDAATDITASALSLTAGSGGIGASGNPLTLSASQLSTNTDASSDGAQFLNASGSVAVTGLNAGTSTATLVSGTFLSSASHVIADATSLSLGHQAVLDLNDQNDSISALSLEIGTGDGADVMTGAGTLTLGSDVTLSVINLGAVGATISGKLNLGGATRSILVANGNAADDLTISAEISGTGAGLTKVGPGTLILSGTNTYNGATTVSAGTLLLDGSIASDTTIGDGATLAGTGTTGPVTVQSGGTVTPGGGTPAVSGLLVGAAGRNQFEEFRDTLGDTFLDFENLAVGTLLDNELAAQGISFATITDVDGNPITPDSMIVSNLFAVSGTRSIVGRNLPGGGADGRPFYEITFSQPQRRAGLVRSNPSGITEFFNDSGTLLATHTSQAGREFVGFVSPSTNSDDWITRIKFSGINLSGSLQTLFTDDVFFGQAEAPVTTVGPGILNTSNVTLQTGSTFVVEIGGLTPGNAANNHDQLNVAGTVTIGGLAGGGIGIGGGLMDLPEAVALVTSAFNGFSGTVGDSFTIINNDGSDAVVGTFAGLAEGAIFNNFLQPGDEATISYIGGDGNDVVVTLTALPATIRGTAFNDTNGNQILDLGESGIGSRTVFVDLDEDRVFDANEPSDVSAADGTYEIIGVPQGFRSIIQIPVLGQGRQPSTRFENLTGGDIVENVDFANQDGFSVVGLNFAGTAELLAQSLVGSGVTISNVTLTGRPLGIGEFTGGRGAGLGIENGIVLSSGDVDNLYGPNDSPGTTTNLGVPGDASLNALIPGFTTNDATVLEFDFIATSDTLSFLYAFGSEEYNEFVGGSFNDVFGFFVDGVNIALINQTTPVAINNINLNMNADLFRNNEASLGTAPFNTELDGFTAVLQAAVTITPGVTHHIKLAIADAGDSSLDSAVFLAADSFVSTRTDVSVTVNSNEIDIFPDGTATLTYTITNNGTVDATGVMLTDVVPAGLTIADVTVSQGLVETVSGVITAAVGILAPSASATVTVTLDPNPDTPSLFSIAATVTANEFDPNHANNEVTTLLDVAFDTPDTPIDADILNNTVPEGAPLGSRVGVTVFAFDHQDEDVFYMLSDDAGGRFEIDPLTGVVTVKSSSLLDFSRATQHTIVARAFDENGNTTPDVPFVINVTDVPNNAPPIASILPNRVDVVEGDFGQNFVTFIAKLNRVSDQTVTIDFTTRRGDDPTFQLPEGISAETSFASDGSRATTVPPAPDPLGPRDFFRSSGRLTFAPGVDEQIVRVQIRPDDLAEPDEFFFVQLQLPSDVDANATIAPPQQSVAVARILDDDSVPQLIVSNAEVLEGDAPNQNQLVFRVELLGDFVLDMNDQPLATTVDFLTGNPLIDTAISDGAFADYTAATGTLTFTPNTRVQFVTVNILGELDNETDETVSLRFENELNLGLSRREVTGTIINDDDNNVVLSINTNPPDLNAVVEGDAGVPQTINFTVTLVGKTTEIVTVDFSTVDLSATGSANATLVLAADYTSNAGTLTFLPGEITKTFSVVVTGDADVEPDEAFQILLSLPASPTQPNVSIDPDRAERTIVIRNDDQSILTEDGDDLTQQFNDAFDDAGGEKDPALVEMFRLQAMQFIEANGLTDYILIIVDPVDFILTDPQNRSSGFTESTGVVNQIPGTYYSGDANVEVLVVPLPPDGTYNVQLAGISGDFTASVSVVSGGEPSQTRTVTQADNLTSIAVQVGNSNVIPVGTGLTAAHVGHATVGVVGAVPNPEFREALAQIFSNLRNDGVDFNDPDLSPTDQLHAAILVARETTDAIFGQLWDSLELSLGDLLSDGLKPKKELPPEVLDGFWMQLGTTLTGLPRGVYRLGNILENLLPKSATQRNKPGTPRAGEQQGQPNNGNNGTKAKRSSLERNRSTPNVTPPNKDGQSQQPPKAEAGKAQGKSAQVSEPAGNQAHQANASRPQWLSFLPWTSKPSPKSPDTRNA